MCSVARSETCKRDWKRPIHPNDQRWLVPRSTTLTQTIAVEKMKYQSYDIKAGVVYKLKIKVKLNEAIKWFVLLLWSVRPWQKKFCWIRVARVFLFIPALPLIKWPVLLSRATSKPFQGSWAYWFIKVDANWHQFTLTKGGCTKIKLMQKAPSSCILHRSHQNC